MIFLLSIVGSLKESELFSNGSAGAEGPREVIVQSEQTEWLINNPAFHPLTEQADNEGRVWMDRHGAETRMEVMIWPWGGLTWTHVTGNQNDQITFAFTSPSPFRPELRFLVSTVT